MSADARGGPEGEWRFDVGFLTDVGLARERNEDACYAFLPYPGERHGTPVDAVFAVADGMGGYEGGDFAGRFVARSVERELAVPGAAAHGELNAWLRQFLVRLNHELCALAAEHAIERGLGSTLTMAVLRGGRLHLGHVGDSRCYRLLDGGFRQMTRDDSWVAEQVRAGLLTPDEAARHPDRNLLTQCLGLGPELECQVFDEPLVDGSRYLLSSDGLHGLVPDTDLQRILTEEPEPQAAAARLVGAALSAGGHDNVTVIVFDAMRADSLATTLPGVARPDATVAELLPRRRRGRRRFARKRAAVRRSTTPAAAFMVAGALTLGLAATLGGWRVLAGGVPGEGSADRGAEVVPSGATAPEAGAPPTPDSAHADASVPAETDSTRLEAVLPAALDSVRTDARTLVDTLRTRLETDPADPDGPIPPDSARYRMNRSDPTEEP